MKTKRQLTPLSRNGRWLILVLAAVLGMRLDAAPASEAPAHAVLQTPADRRLSPFTGYTRRHWLEITERILAGVLPQFDPKTGLPNFDGVPGDRGHASLAGGEPLLGKIRTTEAVMLLATYYTVATGRDRVPGYDGWFVDGPKSNNAFDGYNFWGFQLYTNAICYFDRPWRDQFGESFRDITAQFLQGAPYFFGRDGGPVPWGRSLVTRWGVLAGFGWAHLAGTNSLAPGLTRRIASGAGAFFPPGAATVRSLLTCRSCSTWMDAGTVSPWRRGF